jgi:multiple sugar transport system substrate-binding protein
MVLGPTGSRRRRPARPALTAGAFVAGLALVLSACGSGSSSATAPKTSTAGLGKPPGLQGNATSGTVVWEASPINTSGPDIRTTLIKAFEKAYPHIHVTLQSASTSTTTYESQLTTAIAGGGGPDVYMGDVIWPAQFGSRGFALPLSKYLPKSYFGTFANGLIQGASYNGQVYGAPFFQDAGFLYYRKDLLAADHLPVPKTWAQVQSDSRAMLAKHQVQYGYVFQGADYEGATCDYMEFLADEGGNVLTPNAKKSALLSSSAAVKALTLEDSFVKQGLSPKNSSTFEEAQAMTAFQDGQAGFMRNWDYGYSTSQAAGSKVIGKVGVEPMPSVSASSWPGYSNIGGWNLYINPHSKNVAADLTFVKWMTGPTAEYDMATDVSEIPTINSVRNNPKVKAVNPVLAIVHELKLVARPSQTPKYAAVSQAIYQNVSQSLAGSESPAAAVKAMSSSINTALSGGI